MPKVQTKLRNRKKARPKTGRKPKPAKPRRVSVEDEFAAESRYMNADDLETMGGEAVLTVADTKREKMPSSGDVKRCIYWEEETVDDVEVKPYPLNKVNGRFLVDSVSKFAEEWSGTALKLYLVDTSQGPGIRFELADDEDPDVDASGDEEDEEEDDDEDLE